MPALIVTYQNKYVTYDLPEGKPLVAGRGRECDIILPSPQVSRKHAAFIARQGVFRMKDLGSANGTLLNDKRLEGSHALADGDIVVIAPFILRFVANPTASRRLTAVGQAAIPAEPAAAKKSAVETETAVLAPGGTAPPAREDEPPDRETIVLRKDAGADDADADASDSPDDFPVPPALRRAMETRLAFHTRLFELSDRRQFFRLQQEGLPFEAENELGRQGVELENLPDADEAALLIDELCDRQDNRWRQIRDAKTDDASPQPAPPPVLREIEGLALEQWRLCRDSQLADLPPLFAEAYTSVADEPLAVELAAAGIGHADLMGGAAYYLALATLRSEAEGEHGEIAARFQESADENAPGKRESVIARIGKMADQIKNRGRKKEEAAKMEEELLPVSRLLTSIRREMALLEKILLPKFWRVYFLTVQRFLGQEGQALPPAVRAFIRFGMLGRKSWWLPGKVRDHIERDCRDNVVERPAPSLKATHILYVDEYLAAVAGRDCLPSPDDKAEPPERLSPAWKEERALRKSLNARAREILTCELSAEMELRTAELDRIIQRREQFSGGIASRLYGSKEEFYNLMKERQSLNQRRANLAKLDKRLAEEADSPDPERTETTGAFAKVDTASGAAGRIRRECAILRELGKRLSGPRERLLPLFLREQFRLDQDVVNDRQSLGKEIRELERRDPGLFQETIIHAKKRINEVSVRVSPLVVIVPSCGVEACCARPREGMDGGLLFVPGYFARPDIRKKQLVAAFADFRWETARRQGGFDVMNSNTLAGAFMKIRWDWRDHSRERRERGLIFGDLNDKLNWRRVYEVFLEDSPEGAKRLFGRNPDLYAAIVGVHIDLPAGAKLLKR